MPKHTSDSNNNHEVNPTNTFVVIGAGLPRTGTLSTRMALTHLLGGDCYHMNVVSFSKSLKGHEDINFWDKALEGKATKEDWMEFLPGRGYRAGVDFPVALCYKELMEVFPDAKVVLTVRDPQSWFESCKNTIVQLRETINHDVIQMCGKLLGMTRRSDFVFGCTDRMRGFDRGLCDYIEQGEQESIEFFHQWTRKVIQEVPTERLLVFDVREGWQPLCEFLDLPVPEIPFPRVNATSTMRNVLKFFQVTEYSIMLAAPTLFSALAYYCINNLMLL